MNLKCATMVLALLALAGCGPTEKEKAMYAEQKRVHCLSNICDGETPPKVQDHMMEFAFKVNGEWFIGPREYGGYGGSFAFFWPSKTPARTERAAKDAPEFIPSSGRVTSNFYDVGIEIFMQAQEAPVAGPDRYAYLQQAEAQGRLISKQTPRSGLEVWRIQEENSLSLITWYVAIDDVQTNPNGAVLACRGQADGLNRHLDRCTTDFVWQKGIVVDMRFNAKHGPDWPEIFQETTRVLRLIKKA